MSKAEQIGSEDVGPGREHLVLSDGFKLLAKCCRQIAQKIRTHRKTVEYTTSTTGLTPVSDGDFVKVFRKANAAGGIVVGPLSTALLDTLHGDLAEVDYDSAQAACALLRKAVNQLIGANEKFVSMQPPSGAAELRTATVAFLNAGLECLEEFAESVIAIAENEGQVIDKDKSFNIKWHNDYIAEALDVVSAHWESYERAIKAKNPAGCLLLLIPLLGVPFAGMLTL